MMAACIEIWALNLLFTTIDGESATDGGNSDIIDECIDTTDEGEDNDVQAFVSGDSTAQYDG
jgi:hypothetical protein